MASAVGNGYRQRVPTSATVPGVRSAVRRKLDYPGGKDFAFTIVDDTDDGQVSNLEPVYEFLDDLGLRTTKTVWVQRGANPDHFASSSQTLEDEKYLQFVLRLQRRGFEIAMHLASPGSSRRAETLAAYAKFRQILGQYPKVNINHYANKEGMYWGRDRFDGSLFRAGYEVLTRWGQFLGHVPDSEYFWGDICQEHTKYVRNFTYQSINTLGVNPGMPYHDPHRPFVNYWFSSADGADVDKFGGLLREGNQDRLSRQRGCCIVYTHFGKGFVRDGKLDATWEQGMRALAQRNGWFVPVSQLLDFLLEQRQEHQIGEGERARLAYRWMAERIWERIAVRSNGDKA
jgi:hypothetical protein